MWSVFLLLTGVTRSAATVLSVEVRTSHLEYSLQGWAVVNMQKAPGFHCNASTTGSSLMEAHELGRWSSRGARLRASRWAT